MAAVRRLPMLVAVLVRAGCGADGEAPAADELSRFQRVVVDYDRGVLGLAERPGE